MNMGQEFLQLTAPDPDCGLTYVRGAFDNNPSAILARAQQQDGGRSTFGIKAVEDETGYSWGPIDSEGLVNFQGLLNFRWPYIDRQLKFQGSEAGTIAKLAFVRKGTVYQVIRFSPRSQDQADTFTHDFPADVSETASTAQKRHGKSRGKQKINQPDRDVKLRLGGILRFGCPCQRKAKQQKGYHRVVGHGSALVCTSSNYLQGLEMRLFVDGEAVKIAKEEKNNWGSEVEAVFKHKITLTPGKVTLVIATFKFYNKHVEEVSNDPLPTSTQLREDLGVNDTSDFATDRVWIRQIDDIGGWDYHDCCKSFTVSNYSVYMLSNQAAAQPA